MKIEKISSNPKISLDKFFDGGTILTVLSILNVGIEEYGVEEEGVC
jgi:hypothetical protein